MESNEGGQCCGCCAGSSEGSVREGFRKIALGKGVRMEVSRLRSFQGNDITKAWQRLLNAIAEALPSLQDDCHGNDGIYSIKALVLSYGDVLFKFYFLYFVAKYEDRATTHAHVHATPQLYWLVMSHTQTTRCSSQVYVSGDTTTTLVHIGSCRHLAH